MVFQCVRRKWAMDRRWTSMFAVEVWMCVQLSRRVLETRLPVSLIKLIVRASLALILSQEFGRAPITITLHMQSITTFELSVSIPITSPSQDVARLHRTERRAGVSLWRNRSDNCKRRVKLGRSAYEAIGFSRVLTRCGTDFSCCSP